MTTYVVTGRHRTGTSMMMHALSQYIPAVFDMNTEEYIRSLEINHDYDPNPNGYWNVTTYPHEHPGALVKCNVQLWPFVKEGDYKVVWMQRDENQRIASLMKSFGDEDSPRFIEIGESLVLFLNPTILNYTDVVQDPLSAFTTLKNNGWPIDPETCASIVDESLWRHR